jgi:hypothetical protein
MIVTPGNMVMEVRQCSFQKPPAEEVRRKQGHPIFHPSFDFFNFAVILL